MNRRQFLARAGLVAAGVVAADQLRWGWLRRFFSPPQPEPDKWNVLLTDTYSEPVYGAWSTSLDTHGAQLTEETLRRAIDTMRHGSETRLFFYVDERWATRRA